MSDVVERLKKRPLRRERSISQVHYNLRPRQDEMMAKPLVVPTTPLEVQAYQLQVAGHKNDSTEKRYLGLLQCSNGRVLKPILKDSQQREVDFYTKVFTSNSPDLIELRKFMPKFYGTRKFTYNGYEQEYIMLEDLTERMLEPCIMDVKIGRRTWDPLAKEDKIKKEQSKYKQCKEEYGFCIPGYQVYKLETGKLQKYNKEYGKKLHGHMVRNAIRNFLNGVGSRLCRALVLQLLAALWALQRWCARARPLRFYAASLLLVYDAARLRACCTHIADKTHLAGVGPRPAGYTPPVAPRRRSIHSLHPRASGGSNFSGQISAKLSVESSKRPRLTFENTVSKILEEGMRTPRRACMKRLMTVDEAKGGPVYKKVQSVTTTAPSPWLAEPPLPKSPWSEALDRLHHNHSFDHNYEDKLSQIKMNYRALLDQLSSDSPNPNPWGTVKLIDFAHAFLDENDDVDYNFKEGIDNFVEIFESLLRETDDQIF